MIIHAAHGMIMHDATQGMIRRAAQGLIVLYFMYCHAYRTSYDHA